MRKFLLSLFCIVALALGISAQEVIEDFEDTTNMIPLNQLANGPLPNDSLIVVPNPDSSEVDSSAMVLKFRRSSTGDVWAGFWSELPEPVDMTVNKYVLVKVWRPRISGIKFKVEGGTTDPATFELPSVNTPTKIEEWEQMVFHFPNATGEYPRIALLPDFNDPVGLSEDIVIYVDDIVFSPTNPLEPTGIKDPEKLNYSVYPNPVTRMLYFENLRNVESISIYNSTGQRVLVEKQINSATAKINVASLSPGVYMIAVEDKSGNKNITKVVKE